MKCPKTISKCQTKHKQSSVDYMKLLITDRFDSSPHVRCYHKKTEEDSEKRPVN